MNGSRSKFLLKTIRRPISQNHNNPSRVLGEVWNSYERAKPTQNTPRTCERNHGSERENLQTWQTWTGLTALSDRSDRSSWSSKTQAGQTGQTGCTQTNRKQSFKRQISSKRSPNPTKLGGKLRIYPMNIFPKDLSQKIFPKRLTDHEKSREDQRELGFSQEPKNSNS